jgi:hypothetical protein
MRLLEPPTRNSSSPETKLFRTGASPKENQSCWTQISPRNRQKLRFEDQENLSGTTRLDAHHNLPYFLGAICKIESTIRRH